MQAPKTKIRSNYVAESPGGKISRMPYGGDRMKAETIEKIQELLDRQKHTELDLNTARSVLSHGGPYYINGEMSYASIPDEYAKAMLKAHINNLTRQLAEINEELEAL